MDVDKDKLDVVEKMIREMVIEVKDDRTIKEETIEEKEVIEDVGKIHHNYIMIDYNLRGIITLLEILENVYYDAGAEYEEERQLFKIIKKLVEIEQKEIKKNNNMLDMLTL